MVSDIKQKGMKYLLLILTTPPKLSKQAKNNLLALYSFHFHFFLIIVSNTCSKSTLKKPDCFSNSFINDFEQVLNVEIHRCCSNVFIAEIEHLLTHVVEKEHFEKKVLALTKINYGRMLAYYH